MIEVTFIDWFGIKPVEAQLPPLETGLPPPYSNRVRVSARATFGGKTYFARMFQDISYAPIEMQGEFMLEGWNPAAMLAVNSMADHSSVYRDSFANVNMPISPEEKAILMAVVWCVNFQNIGSLIQTPRMIVSEFGSSKLVESKKFTWQQALEFLGDAKVIQGTTATIKSLTPAKITSPLSIPEAIKSINLKSLENKIIPNYSPLEIAKNWDFWGLRWSDVRLPKGTPQTPQFWPIPVGSFALKAKKEATLRSKPSGKSEKLAIATKGVDLIQTLPLDKSGWWGATDGKGKYGFVFGKDVEIASDATPEESKTEIIKKEPSNMLLYAGIGVGVLVAGGLAFFLLRKQ